MKRLCIASGLALFVHLATIAAQQPPPPKGSIEGVVVRAGSGQPISGARVTATRRQERGGLPAPTVSQGVVQLGVRGAPPVPPTSAMTDNAGKFVLQGLDEGAYSLQAQGNGYVPQNYGQRYAGGPGTAIAVAPGQQLKDIALSLTPAGNVSGRIRDASDQPLPGVSVQLLRYSYNANGQRTFQTAGTASTDDRGEYRIYWVAPGRYYLMAGRPTSTADPLVAMMTPAIFGGLNPSGNPVEVVNDYAYYPGVKDITAARAIDVQPGAEAQAIDVSLSQKPRTYRVRGLVIDGRTGQPPARANVSVTPRTPGTDLGAGLIQVEGGQLGSRHYNPANGTFEIRDLLPGSYVVTASIQTAPATVPNGGTFIPATRSTGSAAITVSDSDVDGVGITVSPAATISGRVRFEGQAPRITSEFIPLQLAPLDSTTRDLSSLRFIATPPGNAEGTFRVDNVGSGEYRVAMLTGVGSYVKEARFGGVDVVNAPLRFSASSDGTLDVLVATARGSVNGIVVDARSQPMPVTQVVLVPDRARDRTDLYRVAATDQNGRFTISGVPPGDYKVFSWEALEQYAWFDPDVLARAEGSGRAVHVTESSETVEVRLIPAGGTR